MVSVQVHENDAAHKPCYVKSKSVSTGSYKRQDDKDILLSPTELFEMQNVYKPSEADRAPSPTPTAETSTTPQSPPSSTRTAT